MDLAYYKKREKQMLVYPITIYWWNHGSRTIDFEGTMKDCLKKKDITFKRIYRSTSNEAVGYRFKYEQGRTKMTYDYWGEIEDGAMKVIQFQLVYLGDKSTIHFMSRTRTVNH